MSIEVTPMDIEVTPMEPPARPRPHLVTLPGMPRPAPSQDQPAAKAADQPDAAPGLAPATKAEIKDLRFYYRQTEALKGVSLPLYDKRVTAFIGPSGCGKSTLPARLEPHL